MADRCYMEVTCRRKDIEQFEEIGFTLQDWNNEESQSPTVVMVDEEANYGHSDEMPRNIPYFGHNEHGDNYSDAVFACDGKRYAEVEAGYAGGFVVQWDAKKQRPTPQSLKAIRQYLSVRNNVRRIFEKLSTASINNPRKEEPDGTDHTLLTESKRA